MSAEEPALIVRHLGLCDYLLVWRAMQEFTATRHSETPDELWTLQHFPVFTQGLNGKPEHVLAPGDIPVIKIDRGGQVTYHGPGQLVVYCLFDLRRKQLGIRQLVTLLENAVIELLAAYHISAYSDREAPGVYAAGRKLASLGLRVRRGCSYHGLSLNIDMDLSPFQRINPCGYRGLEMTQLSELGCNATIRNITDELCRIMIYSVGYPAAATTSEWPCSAQKGRDALFETDSKRGQHHVRC